VTTTDVAKLVSKAWKSLSIEERETWEEMARQDKARYEVEKDLYTGPWKVPSKKRSQKDPNAPKRPMSAFLSYSNCKRSQVKAQNQDVGNAEISRMLAKMWKEAPAEERKDHIDKEFKLRQKYKTAIAEWRKNSEHEFQAARKEREDEAHRIVRASQGAQGTPKMPEQSLLMEDPRTFRDSQYFDFETSSQYQRPAAPRPPPGYMLEGGKSTSYPQPFGYGLYADAGPTRMDDAGPYPSSASVPYYDNNGRQQPSPHDGYYYENERQPQPPPDGYGPQYQQGYGYPHAYGRTISPRIACV
jgi:hypothetical protein